MLRKSLLFLLTLVSLGVFVMLSTKTSWQDTPLIDFATLQLPAKENYTLVYQQQQLPRLIKAPIFAVNAEKLQQIWQQIAAQQPRLELLKMKENHFQYVQRSRLIGFPDLIDVKIVALSEQTSTIYLYSRSVYGYSDFKVNIERVNNWLHLCHQAVTQVG